MSTTAAAVPGTVVPASAQVSPGGPQGIQGSQGPQVLNGFVSKTSAYTVVAADRGQYFICSGGSWTLTLPTASIGFFFSVRNDQGITGTTGTITLSPPSGTIDGSASLALLPAQACTVTCDGTNWRTFGLQREVVIGTQDIISSTASSTILLPVGYRLFELDFANFQPITSGNGLYGQLSVNGGSSWITGGYYTGIVNNQTVSTVQFTDQENTNQIAILPGMVTATNYGAQGRMTIYPGNGSTYPSALVHSGARATISYQVEFLTIAYEFTTFGPINALQYFTGGGNINACSVTVKGIV